MKQHDQVLRAQAETMQRLTNELLRRYQMRDRNEITCNGVTVSQCYALAALGEHGELTMAQLARQLHLDKSTATRAIDPLVKRGLVTRQLHDQDRREIWVKLTPSGEQLHTLVRDCLIRSQLQILLQIPPEKREPVLEALQLLAGAVQQWLSVCCPPGKVTVSSPPSSNEKRTSP